MAMGHQSGSSIFMNAGNCLGTAALTVKHHQQIETEKGQTVSRRANLHYFLLYFRLSGFYGTGRWNVAFRFACEVYDTSSTRKNNNSPLKLDFIGSDSHEWRQNN
ncbi:hypothetical protein Zmor_002536 [Zophobas morio]|uniref:Uncharacterized protein n=1 Tax=Zophobas morio TaxID=2755281 RepID=A0AA38MQ77_9CUCU|nr:hypothetical protein Zmor_002536 [Zophobas morio]